ncbi:MAG: hypothetical protein H0U70_08290 [Tatlockia sp.]|nr:hypothetical protein [Tatlockia sp.]
MASLAIENLIEEWAKMIANSEKKGNRLFFGHSSDYNERKNLYQTLGLSRAMSLSDLEKALQVLENITLETQSLPKFISLTESLKEKKFRTLESMDLVKKPNNDWERLILPISENCPLHHFLIKNHDLLLSYYEIASLHANAEIPVSEFNYNKDQLIESQAFLDLETTSREKHSPDDSTIVPDLIRKGVSLSGIVKNGLLLSGTGVDIEPYDRDNPLDPAVLQAIERFTNDSLAFEYSTANKILNFGGQTLEATLLQEFKNTTHHQRLDLYGIEPGLTKSYIDWFKNYESGEFYAKIHLKLLTCAYTNPVDLREPTKIFAIGSDGLSLIELNNDELEPVMQLASAEVSGSTKGNMVAICEIQGKIDLDFVPTVGYQLKVAEFKVHFNTPDLVSIKHPDFKPSSSVSSFQRQ